MTRSHDELEPRCGAAWEVFAQDEAAARAPQALEHRVLCAVRAAAQRRTRRALYRRLRLGTGMAAALLLTGVFVWRASTPQREPEARANSAPTEYTESLQLVRVRMPRTALMSLGVALIEPEATAFVDVEVVVGDDGLPLEVHRIRPVVEAAVSY